MAYRTDAGVFRTPITILKVGTKKNSDHMPVKVTEEYFKCKAKVSSYKNTEKAVFWTYGQIF